MALEIGAIVEGTVTGITKFGAFVGLPEGKSGLVHISEIANSYVGDVNDFLKMNQKVKVKVIGIKDGKINLSIKKAEENTEPVKQRTPAPHQQRSYSKPETPKSGTVNGPSEDEGFEDKLKKFMQESDSRIAGNPMYADRGKSRRRRG